jgi:hypothetical protein
VPASIQDPALRAFLESIRSALRILAGQAGTPAQTTVIKEELAAAIAEVKTLIDAIDDRVTTIEGT